MTCKICGQIIGMIWSRQIYVEQRPADNFCKDCFEAFVPKYDKLIEEMKCTTNAQTAKENPFTDAISN